MSNRVYTDRSPAPSDPIPKAVCLPLTSAKEEELRQQVIKEGLKWVGTPYHQQADKLGAGIDCSMLLVRAWVDAGVVEPFDPRPYPPDWHMHQSEERYLAWMSSVAKEIPAEERRPGDVVLFKFGRCFAHSGILVTKDTMVHAWAYDGKCSVCDLTESWVLYKGRELRPRKFFDVWARIREVSQ